MAKQFDNLRASELYCPKCRTLRSVRERLLLILPDGGEIHAYCCSACGDTLGTKEVRLPPGSIVRR